MTVMKMRTGMEMRTVMENDDCDGDEEDEARFTKMIWLGYDMVE